jgi:hypothetical protein
LKQEIFKEKYPYSTGRAEKKIKVKIVLKTLNFQNLQKHGIIVDIKYTN